MANEKSDNVSRQRLDSAAALDQLDDDLANFELVMQDLLTPTSTQLSLLQRFDTAWNDQGFIKPWPDHRGALDETVLNWVLLVNYEGEGGTVSERRQLLNRLVIEMIAKYPALTEMPFAREPFTGQTPLMQATANGNEELVEELLKHATVEDLNAVASGSFIREKVTCPLKSFSEQAANVSVLEIAAIAPLEDVVSIRLVQRLLDAHADPGEHVMARLALCGWRNGGVSGELVRPERLANLVNLVVARQHDPQNQPAPQMCRLATMQAAGNENRRTPMQEAAKAGHDNFILKYMQSKQKVVWQWGHRRQVCLPLEELDREPHDPSADVLELLVLHKHKETLCMVVFADMIEKKWVSFGLKQVINELVMMTLVVAIVTFACLPKSIGVSGATRPLRLIALVGTVLLLVSRAYPYYKAAKTSEFFQNMYVVGTVDRLGLDDCAPLRDICTMALGIVVLSVHEIETIIDVSGISGYKHLTLVILDALSSLYVFTSWLGLLRYMQYFEQTCVLVAVLPAILKRDMIPWVIIYVGILFSTAVAMRVSSWHTNSGSAPGDDLLGTPYQAAWTLEESTHGPDVHWRTIVMGQPMMCAAFFLAFLWIVTVIMFNLLISIFSNSFDKRRSQASCELRYWRAVQVVYYEKMMSPAEWYRHRIGHHRGASAGGMDCLTARSSRAQLANEETPLVDIESQNAGLYWLAINEVVGEREWCTMLPPG